MGTPLLKTLYQPRFGVAVRHWTTLLNYSARAGVFLFLRGGKEAAIPWIDRGFPGKPIDLKIKVDRRQGLLFATSGAEREAVFGAGHLVLTELPGGFKATDRSGKAANQKSYSPGEGWVRPGVVIDAGSGSPFTSDYDLAAVIPARDLDYVRDLSGVELGKSRTNALAERSRADLNAAFGSARIRHGPQALFDQKFSNDPGERETIVAFCPNGDAYVFETPPSEAAAVMQYRDLLIALHPKAKASFNN